MKLRDIPDRELRRLLRAAEAERNEKTAAILRREWARRKEEHRGR
jgi:hypothetical protein